MAKTPRTPKPFTRLHNSLNVTDLRKKLKDKNITKRRIISWLPKIAIGGVIFIALLFAWYAKDLPTPQGIRRNFESEQTTKIFDRTGQHLLYAISGQQRRISIPYAEMPEHVRKAFIALEDKNFYEHKGIDLRGVARSVYYDITRRTVAYGGSTITQQLVKNAIIQSGKKHIDRKAREAILSIELEAMYSKDQILELYLNEIPFGGSTYGIEAAAQTYMGKKAKDLTLEESATLAAMVQRPSYYSPYGSHIDELKGRRDFALTQMKNEGYITEAQAKEAQAKPMVFVPRKDTILAPHFVMYVRDIIAEKYGEEIFSKGLTITTSLDVEQQKSGEQAIASGAAVNKEKYGINNASLVSLNPKTGEVLAMVGSADYFNNEINGQFNVATAKRQPGSSFKPLVYATALKQKYSPSFVFYDVPTDFGKYKPGNFDGRFRGPVTMREALGQSLNIPAVKALGLAGLKEAVKTATDLGITTLEDPGKYGLSLVLGSAETRPIEMAQAYGVFANQGVRQDIAPILKIEDKDKKVLEEFKPEKGRKSALDPQIAYLMSNMLSDQIAKAPVFGNQLAFGDRQVASKTGTTNGIGANGQNDVRDAWTVGYVPSLSVAVWVGNSDHSPLGKGVLASNAAVPIFKSYMNQALRSIPNEAFSRPAGITTVTVDKLSNRLPSDATPPDGVITDIFASWQVPTKLDDIHLKVKLCKGTNLLANDETPASEIEEKYFVNIHSEKPNDPAWEDPVRAWADANGFNNRPPTEKCDTFNEQNRPQVSITSPTNEATVNGNFSIQANASSSFGVSQVEFFVDGQSVSAATSAPYQTSYNATSLSSGSHTIAAEVKDVHGRTSRTSVTVVVSKETSAPANVGNVTVAPGKGTATLAWTNPGDGDISRVRTYISENSGELGLRYSTETEVKPSSSSSLTISGLSSNKIYYFTIRPVDTSNNENQSAVQYSATVQ